ncbi:NADH-quinone oxidoreductase subunit NuoB [Caminibacter mediatlanticus TB-2]|uniref:NADH-quinone oxidoreductase subunit NuoB n=1 Tax=Caminibacter mediatlanticus TB-2 TaxID=391592 RepID=A0ABX5VA87_9BACT|nr:NADH-quinone oxidoreductase subunit B family protein [Caminibacter mediatlanticus]QCT95203.1 NADH-quinone oxidoreductase subunit NuoB [Caminibacter mediatlanticus TB-2]
MSKKPKVILDKDIFDNNSLEDKLRLLKDIKRSFSVFRVDCGSCNGCEIEIFAAITPMWDPERFGFKLVASPRHADILLCTGPLTRQMYYPLLRAYEATPDPKVVIAVGACGCTGGIFHDSYAVWSGIDSTLPVDVYIPGCPPHPATIIHGLAVALGILDQKMKKVEYKDDEGEAPEVEKPILGNLLFERDVYFESKRLMGYLYGKQLYKKFLDIIKNAKNPLIPEYTKKAVIKAVKEEIDFRFAECYIILYNEVYLRHLKDQLGISGEKICFDVLKERDD